MSNNFQFYNSNDFPSHLPALGELYRDLFEGGKALRPYLVRIVGSSLELPEEKIQRFGSAIEYIHNASLLHDDLLDKAPLRRSKKAAWLKYTPEYAVLAGDFLITRALINLSQSEGVDLIKYTCDKMAELVEGEWLQDAIAGRDHVTLEEFNQVCYKKTSSLFQWCLYAPFLSKGLHSPRLLEGWTAVSNIFGLLFQRGDDLVDFNVRNFEGKSTLTDLVSGSLNSFSAFISEKLDPKSRSDFFKSKDFEEIYKSLGGRERFNEYVEDFDKLNQELIVTYHKKLEQMSECKGVTPDLLNFLQSIPKMAYWRAVAP